MASNFSWPRLPLRIAFFALAPLLGPGPAGAAATESLKVIDGNTVAIDGHSMRLAGIEAPMACQPGAAQAAQSLDLILIGRLTYEPAGRDAEGRRLVRLYANGRDIAHSMVELGWAWSSPYSNDLGRGYAAAEAEARQAGIGLWSGSVAPIAPWQWRRKHPGGNGPTCPLGQANAVAGQAPMQTPRGGMKTRGADPLAPELTSQGCCMSIRPAG
jgi:endonuclease YncB( thermonuclease family)